MCCWLNVTNAKETTEQCVAPNTQTMAVSFQTTTKPVSRSLKLERGHWILSFKIRVDQREIKTEGIQY